MKCTIAIIALLVTSCGGTSDPITCGEAIPSFYQASCTITSGGKEMSQQTAHSLCISGVVNASAIGGACPGLVDEMLDCMARVDRGGCEGCNPAFGRALVCM